MNVKDKRCSICGKEVQPLPYICKYCGKVFCVEHRLPEKHKCENLSKVMETVKIVRTEDLLEEIAEFERARKTLRNPLRKLGEKLRFGKK
ncbi:hypothetical protein DRO26_00845 [Candidatus Bathyarchaeota archaeon]|nr:MAG: hypothetical protein DRO26_00845 [Candidatus Bathyarchaeota archaeon]